MLIRRGRGTLLLARLGLLRHLSSHIGAFSDTVPGDNARGLARKRPLARDWPADWPADWPGDWPADWPGDRPGDWPGDRPGDWPGLKVAIASRDGLRATPLTRLPRPSTAGVSAHG